MWIYTQYGFYSIVADYQKGGLLIRSRIQKDLELLAAELEKAGFTGTIETTPDRDYRYRIGGVPYKLVAKIISNEIQQINYHNFKNRVHQNDHSPWRGDAYMDVWATMRGLQE